MRPVKALFLEALDRAPDEREAFVRAAAGEDRALCEEVMSLLAHHSEAELIAPAAAAAPVSDPVGLLGVTLDGRYEVEAFVAEGGFGFVYRARRLRWDEPVAVKVFKRLGEGEPAALERAFIAEGKILNRLSRQTTAIVQCHDVGSWTPPHGAPLLFTVLEWLDGHTLGDRAEPERRWSVPEILSTLAPVADALAVAHTAGIAHRDVKPNNVFVTRSGLKLLDFGVAKVAAEHQRGFHSTGDAHSAVSAIYAAPEQLSSSPTGPWTDVYALALVCVELMNGGPIHPGASLLELLMRVADPKQRPTPRALGLAVGDAVEAVFACALAVSHEERYPDVASFWAALERAHEEQET